MSRKIGILALTLLGAFALAAIVGVLPAGIPSITNFASVEASNHKPQSETQKSVSNQQAISDAITAHGADKWHEAGFTGAGVKIGVIDFGFGSIEDHIGTEVPDPTGVRCYSFNLNPSAPPTYTSDIADCEHTDLHFSRLHGSSVLEAVYDIAPEADYYLAAVSQFSFYHTDLKDAVDWMIEEDVDIITFSHVGAWSGPGDGTSIYPTSELNTLNNAVNNGITWISPAGDRAHDTWSGFFTDTDSDDIHEFLPGIECNDVDLSETDHPYRVQLRWADTWGAATRDFELSLVDKGNGEVVATSQKAHFAPNDPNELLDFTTPDNQASYCLRLELKTPIDEPVVVNMQSYGRHGLSYPSLFGSITSPGESNNDGALTVGAAPVGNPEQVQPFSGRGPMNSRNIKPDIVGVDDTHSVILGRVWESTSLAAAHVTGLAALVKQRYPNYTPQQIAEYLKNSAEGRPILDPILQSVADPNNTWGHGFAMLPDDVEDAMPPMVDTCLQTIDGSGTYTGSWDDTCLSENRPDGDGGDSDSDYYARFFTFMVDEDTNITIDLTSDADTFLYLMEGSDKDGAIEAENDDISTGNRNSRIEGLALSAGTYTIEAATYNAETAGEFTLVVEIEEVDEPTEPEPGMRYTTISSGANHVCAIATDGSIMCWGDNDYGQVSDRPTRGSFTQISSGDNHTCALRSDGAVICWGSIDVP